MSQIILTVDGRPFLVSGNIAITGPITELPSSSTPIFKLEGDTGVVGGATITSWTDSVGGLVLAPNAASPSAGVLDSGAAGVLFTGTNEGLVKLDGVGSLPVGNASRTVFLCVRYDDAFFSGIGWGTNVVDQAFTLGVDNEHVPCVDFFGGSRILAIDAEGDLIKISGRMYLLCADHNSATNETRLFLNDVLVGSRTQAITTGSTRINLFETFSNASVPGQVGAAYVFSTALSDADRHATSAYLIEKYIRDTTAPVITGDAILATGTTTANATVTVDELCNLWWGIKTGATPPTVANLKAGTGFAAGAFGTFFSNAVTSAINATGLTPGQTYYLFTYAEDIATPPNASVVEVSTGMATPSSTAAPVISIGTPVLTSVGGTFPWNTDTGNGTARLLVSSNTTESLATIKSTGNPITIAAAGAQSHIVSGLGPTQTRTLHIVHTNIEGQDSNIDKETFTTLTEVGGSTWAEHAVVSSAADLRAKLLAWGTSPGSDLPSGKSFTDEKIVAINTTITMGSGSDNLAGIVNTGGRIWVRCKGTYNGTTGCSVKVNGPIDLSGSRKLGFTRMNCVGPTSPVRDGNKGGNFTLNNSHDIIINRNWLTATPGIVESSFTADTSWSFSCIHVEGYGTNIVIRENFMEMFADSAINMDVFTDEGRDIIIDRNVLGYGGHDDFKAKNLLRLTFTDNWGTRSTTGDLNVSPSSHFDFFQIYGPTGSVVTDCLFDGNVHLSGHGSSWSGTVKTNQSYWMDDFNTVTNCTWQRQITATNNKYIARGNHTNTIVRNSLFLPMGPAGAAATEMRGACDYNFWCGQAGTSDYGGPNGISYLSNVNAPNLTPILDHFVNGVPFSNGTAGGIPSTPHQLERLLPKTTSRLHWNHASPLPISAVLQRYFDTTFRYGEETSSGRIRIPGDLGWPTAYHWTRYFNRNNYLSTRFSTYHGVGTSPSGITHGIGAGGSYTSDAEFV